jgi:hypothetical protein
MGRIGSRKLANSEVIKPDEMVEQNEVVEYGEDAGIWHPESCLQASGERPGQIHGASGWDHLRGLLDGPDDLHVFGDHGPRLGHSRQHRSQGLGHGPFCQHGGQYHSAAGLPIGGAP